MRVTLVLPNVAKHVHVETFEPLGILYIAAEIRELHDVQIVDSFNRKLDMESTLEEILSFNPDVVGISLTMSPTVPFGRTLAEKLKRTNPAVRIIVGGTHATFAGEQLATDPNIDIIVLHEGEFAVQEILRCLEGKGDLTGVKGIFIRNNGNIVKTPEREPVSDLDSLSFPARHLLPSHMIYDRKHILSSRGCVYRCIYCASSAMNRYHWRARSPRNVVAEIEVMASQYSRTFSFADDNFPVNRKRTIEICNSIIKCGLNIKWSCLARIEFIDDEELLKTMALSGCKEIFIGVESGSDQVLEKMKRNYTAADVKRVVRLCFNAGILTTVSFIIGNPYERLEDVRKTFELVMDLCTPNVAFHIFTPYIGTQAFASPKDFGLTILSGNPEEYEFNKEPIIQTQNLSREQIMELYCESFGISLRKGRQKLWKY